MLKGIGVDIIEIKRVRDVIARNKRFIDRIFTDAERKCFFLKEDRINYQRIAGNFAAKEAVLKSLGTGLKDFKWKDIEVHRDELGKPCINLYNNTQKFALDNSIIEILISISHCREYAVAQAVALLKEG